MDEEESWDTVEGEAVSDTSFPLLYWSGLALYLCDMFIGAEYVHGRSYWYVFYDNFLQGCELSICVQSYNPKSQISIVYVHLIEGSTYCLDFPVRKMVYHGKVFFSAKDQE